MNRPANRKRANGHARANGSGVSACAAQAQENTELGKAGSDVASVFSVANAPSLASMAGTDRKASADLAESAAKGRSRAAGAASGSAASVKSGVNGPAKTLPAKREGKSRGRSTAQPAPENRFAAIPPGRKRLPANGEAFVKAVHKQVDLIALEVALLRDPDEKIVQRELAYLRELRYGKRAPAEEDATQIVVHSIGREGEQA